jgi:hypothetical protein
MQHETSLAGQCWFFAFALKLAVSAGRCHNPARQEYNALLEANCFGTVHLSSESTVRRRPKLFM